jgi:hypothetical protein
VRDNLNERQNFISVDRKMVLNSNNECFSIGESCGHEGADKNDYAIITAFEEDKEENEIKFHSNKGFGRIDFLIKL